MWNRDPASPSFGSFDRQWWGWKFKDFGDATLQYAARLTIAYAEEIGATATLPALVEGFVGHVQQLQLRDGSFDQCYPNERTPGVIYDILSTLVAIRRSGWVGGESARQLDDAMSRAVGFCLRTDEKHGEVANHIAEFAYELLNYAAFSGDERARRRALGYLDRLLSLFEREEGWFHEYHGPDAGYQTRALRYVTRCAELLDDTALWDVAERAARFVGELLMPDGSVHPMLGVRSTALVYPSAFERLAARDSQFRPLADRIRYGWEKRRVPMPSAIDFQNAVRLADDARDAAELAGDTQAPVVPPPITPTDGWRVFEKAGVMTRKTDRQALYVGVRLGGPVVMYGRETSGDWTLRYEDAGYLLRDDKVWVSRAPNAGELVSRTDEAVVLRTRFHRSLHDEVTPGRMLLLRLLNLTVLRSQLLGDLFRKIVVRHLMGEHPPSAVALERTVRVEGEHVQVRDRIIGRNGAKLFRCRRLTGMHMASSRYFQDAELAALPVGWCDPVEGDESIVDCGAAPDAVMAGQAR